MVNDIIEELLDLAMERKTESLWWTSTYKDEDAATVKVGSRGKTWDQPVMEVFDVLMGRGVKAQNTRCAKVRAVGGGTSSSVARWVHPC